MVASQLEFFEVPSPCIGICQSDDKGYCMGCFRTREERQNWLEFDADTKQKVIKRCQQRKKRKSSSKQEKQIPLAELKPAEQQPSLFDVPKTKIHIDKDMDFSDFDL